MNQYYDRIMELPDSYEIKDIVKRWQNLSENLKTLPQGMPIILPDLFLIGKYGVGRTLVLNLLAEYLAAAKNLMNFYGNVKFFEFYLNYCAPDRRFDELPRLMEAISSAAGFRSEYRGIVCLDVTEWLKHVEEKHFLNLLEYVADHSNHWLVVLTVSSGSDAELKRMEAILAMFLRIDRAELRMPETDELLAHVIRKLEGYNLRLSEDAEKLIAASIEKMSSQKYFDGYNTLNMLISDIAYSVFSKPSVNAECICAEDLADFSVNGTYINTRLHLCENKVRYTIGFTGGIKD